MRALCVPDYDEIKAEQLPIPLEAREHEMKLRLIVGLIGCSVALVSCQSSGEYMKIADGPEREYAYAKCDIASMSTEQGMFAMGSPGYVLGAQLGNAIGNEVRKQQFIKNCMVMHGWKEVPKGSAKQQQRLVERQTVRPRTVKTVGSHVKGSFAAPPVLVIAGQ